MQEPQVSSTRTLDQLYGNSRLAVWELQANSTSILGWRYGNSLGQLCENSRLAFRNFRLDPRELYVSCMGTQGQLHENSRLAVWELQVSCMGTLGYLHENSRLAVWDLQVSCMGTLGQLYGISRLSVWELQVSCMGTLGQLYEDSVQFLRMCVSENLQKISHLIIWFPFFKISGLQFCQTVRGKWI